MSNEKKQFHLKIKWKNNEKTEAHEIVLYDGGQPLCELISVDDARLVRDVLNEQDNRIRELERIHNICEEQITELRRLVNIATNNDFIKKSKKEEWKKELMKE